MYACGPLLLGAYLHAVQFDRIAYSVASRSPPPRSLPRSAAGMAWHDSTTRCARCVVVIPGAMSRHAQAQQRAGRAGSTSRKRSSRAFVLFLSLFHRRPPPFLRGEAAPSRFAMAHKGKQSRWVDAEGGVSQPLRCRARVADKSDRIAAAGTSTGTSMGVFPPGQRRAAGWGEPLPSSKNDRFIGGPFLSSPARTPRYGGGQCRRAAVVFGFFAPVAGHRS
jgi:hypothetical protein